MAALPALSSFFDLPLCDVKRFEEKRRMYTNVNLAAAIGVMLFLGAALVLAAVAVVFLFSLVTKKYRLMRAALLAGGIVEISYLLILVTFSFSSSEQRLSRGKEKHFCEIDCHLAYSIAGVEQLETLTSAGKTLKANGTFYLVTVKTRFDETTISPRRGSGNLQPNPRSIAVIDAEGRRFEPSVDAQGVLQDTNRIGTPIETPLRPAESYLTVYAFDLPRDVHAPALLINESDWVTRLIIGHENSIAHKKTSLLL